MGCDRDKLVPPPFHVLGERWWERVASVPLFRLIVDLAAYEALQLRAASFFDGGLVGVALGLCYLEAVLFPTFGE